MQRGQRAVVPSGGGGSDVRPRRSRADGRRNLEAILDAGLAVFSADPAAGINQVGEASGLTRTTVYAHFPSREVLLDALVTRAVSRTVEQIVAGRPEEGPVLDALRRVVNASWREVFRHHKIHQAAVRALGGQRLEEHHEPVRARLSELVERGQREDVVRVDVPMPWLLGTYFALIHLAGEQVVAGALSEESAPEVLFTTIAAAWTRGKERLAPASGAR